MSRLFKPTALFYVILVLCTTFLQAEASKNKVEMPKAVHGGEDAKGYTINFENVSILEFMKFISKISNVNFIYEPNDLNFSITVMSDEPATLENVMAAFVQVLRINGFNLIQDGNNYLINRSNEIKQIPTIISDEMTFDGSFFPAFVTRVFHVKNTSPSRIAQLLVPMMSGDSIVEVMESSKLIIITDVTANINQAAKLIGILDTPRSPFQLGTFYAKNNSVDNLKTLGEQIILPIAGEQVVVLVPQPTTNTLFVVSTPFLINEMMHVLSELDASPLSTQHGELSEGNIFIYKVKYRSPQFVENSLMNIATHAEQLGFSSNGLYETIAKMKYLKATDSLLFIGPASAIERIKAFLEQIDIPGKPYSQNEHAYFFMFHPKNVSPEEAKKMLIEIGKNMDASGLSDQALIYAIENARIIESTQSILFTADSQTIEEIKKISGEIDQEGVESPKMNYLMYTPKYLTPEELLDSIHDVANKLENSGLSDPNFINALDHAKYVSSSKSVVFTGNKESIEKVQNLLAILDLPDHGRGKQQIFLYKPTYVSKETLEDALAHFAATLPNSNPAKESIENAKWIKSSESFVFQGTDQALNEIKQIIAVTDVSEANKSEIFVFKPQYASKEMVENALGTFADSLAKGSSTRLTIENMKWIPSSHSFVFKGSSEAIAQIKQILAVTDVDDLSKENKTYYIYKLKYISGDVVIGDLKRMARNLSVPKEQKKSLMTTIDNIEWVKSTNSLFITGSKNDVDQVRNLIVEFDSSSGEGKKLEPSSSFLIYKPIHTSAEDLEASLKSLGEDLEDSGLTDTSLLNTINSVKLSESTHSLVFTGTQSNLEKVKQLLKTIDLPKDKGSEIQKVGLSTFLIYKIKYAAPQYLMHSLKQLAEDMEDTKGADKELIRAIDSMRYVKETNSLIFTGNERSLEKIKSMLEKFDLSGEQGTVIERRGGYSIYKPKYVPGAELINLLKDFEYNLQSSGITDPSLFDAINNLKWMEKTDSIIISGNQEDTTKIKELLEKFDIPQKGVVKPANIETIEDISFLMYKLQYHQGDEIVTALKQIAVDLQKGKEHQESEQLIRAIQSIQWIKVTNSLIGTGEPRTLEKLRELLYSIDIPLTQVFIEVLVIKTTLGKRLDFGLQWGSQGKYRNRFGYGFGNFPSTSTDNGTFATNLSKVTATNTPTGSDIPFLTGGDLGIIGDIILHKGKSYFALGSLVNALEQDGDTTIVINQKIVAQDNKEASLFVGANIPFSGSVVQIIGQTQTTSSNLEYRDIGTSLKLLPKIGENNIITLDIDLEISSSDTTSLSSDTIASTVTSQQLSSLITDKTTMTTRLHVPDNHFLAISGQIRDQMTHDRTGVPCLGGLPIIGAAFSNNQSTKEMGNVIMFVRPRIISSNDVWKNITERQEEIYRSQAEPEAYDAGIELVATPEDE